MTAEVRDHLWPYMGGIARENKMKALAVGGHLDHAHVLLSLPATVPISKAMQLIKSGSSLFIHETFRGHHNFAWQEGYGAFTIGVSEIERTVEYIHGQEEHHRLKTFQEEFLAFLQKHQIEYDEKYIWG